MTPGEERVLEAVRRSLSRDFAGVFSPETVAACLIESYDQLATTARVDILSCSRSVSLATVSEPRHKWRES